MKRVKMEVTNRGAVYINGTRVTDRDTKWGVHTIVHSGRVYPHRVTHNLVKHGYAHIKLDADYAKELGVE